MIAASERMLNGTTDYLNHRHPVRENSPIDQAVVSTIGWLAVNLHRKPCPIPLYDSTDPGFPRAHSVIYTIIWLFIVAEVSSGDRPDEIGDHKWNSFPKLIFDLLGRYAFSVPEAVTRGELRPLRNPAEVLEEVA